MDKNSIQGKADYFAYPTYCLSKGNVLLGNWTREKERERERERVYDKEREREKENERESVESKPSVNKSIHVLLLQQIVPPGQIHKFNLL